MSATTLAPTAGTVPRSDCTPAQRVTRSLLGYGVIAGPFYVATSLAQALAHDGFDLTRHAWSQLAAGPQGWIQMANLVLTGAMVVAFSVGLRRSSSSRWAPRLVATYGVGLFVSGGIGFAAFIAACFVLARTFARSGARRLAWWSRLTGVGFTAAFVGISSGSSRPALILTFVAAVLAAW